MPIQKTPRKSLLSLRKPDNGYFYLHTPKHSPSQNPLKQLQNLLVYIIKSNINQHKKLKSNIYQHENQHTIDVEKPKFYHFGLNNLTKKSRFVVDSAVKSSKQSNTGNKAKITKPKIIKCIPSRLIAAEKHLISPPTDIPLYSTQHLPRDYWKLADNLSQLTIPLATETIPAGFPSPAEPYISDYLDFNQYLIKNQAATIAVRCGGDSMHDAGISRNDLLIIDRSLSPKHRDIVMADLGNEFTIKRLHKLDNGGIELHSENSNQSYPNFSFKEGDTLTIVGVITYVIKHVR